ncbi:MAG: glycosyltransferase family 2 protein [Anaerolineae bacterium]|nr:glycosyltransferase family 2 protein [Anaerolineae bacterium]
MPCLNEADTVSVCVQKACRALFDAGISGEVIVADNGSTDGSQQLAQQAGARVVPVAQKGYGNALMGGIDAARGCFVIMGDADDSYDFLQTPRFVAKLREGYDIVQGCRLPAGGGVVMPGAMPFLHRWLGNPMFSFLARWWFGAPIHDIYCGLRGFTKDWYVGLNQRCVGMEFATEMIIKSSLMKAKIAEIPITLHPDGRKAHPPHLRTFRDGWRTLRFFLMYTPRWLFLLPGILLMVLGCLGYGAAFLSNTSLSELTEVRLLLISSLLLICGYQAIWFSILAKTFAVMEDLMPESPGYQLFFRYATIERGIALALIILLVGLVLTVIGVANFSPAVGLNLLIVGITVVALGIQTMLSSFFVSLLGLKRR